MTRHTGLLRLVTLIVIVLALGGCGRFKWFQKDEPLETLPVDQMYDTGKQALETGNLSRARRYYQRLIARFPYGPYTEQAQLELAYAQYKGNNPEDAMSSVNRFIRTYPTHPHIDYAYYLKALINFNRENAFLDRIARIDMTQRDQGAPRQAFNDFAELLNRYPNSVYAADARQRMVHLRNQMARHEITVAKYYLRRHAWVAAANRGQYVLEHYPQSMYDGDALALMSESYHRLGQDKLAADSRRVLQLNHPDHSYLRGDWPAERSLWQKPWPFGDDDDDSEDADEGDAVAEAPPAS